ncbi:hypothetical protein ACSL103130_08260 [Actinomyces slackii]|uniref:Histidine kinase N-terminal 7TM region domain-containing protein n=1 Tax=Actinomyces slackii TaxID=52774 RepID=A0A3S4U0Z0_9ACTO|nr:hypothetical protein [Actinomyces slackii]VEG73779.1 Uncharacterised protein [Actinomyces slackii]
MPGSITSLIVVGVAVALLLVVLVLHKGRGPRTVLLRWAAATMLISAVLRESTSVLGDVPVIDLIKRLIFLVTMTTVIILVLTFRRTSITRRAARRYWWLAGAVGILQCALFWLMPLQSDGSLYPYTEAGRSPAILLYYGLFDTTIAVTAIACGYGCVRALMRGQQPLLARISLILGICSVVTAVGYVVVGWLALLESVGSDYDAVHRQLFLATIAFLLGMIAVGGIRTIVVEGQSALATSVGTDIVEPLWREVTRLHPGVMLPADRLTRRERLVRLVVETNDALHLIRRSSADAPGVLTGEDPSDPDQTADLLIHLLGESAAPQPPGLRTRLLMRVSALMPDDEVASSVKELYALRLAFAARDRQRALPAR